jgi:hypothetical protein
MPIKGANERWSNYRDKLDPERVKQDLEKHRETMLAKQSQVFNDQATIEDLVKSCLADEDIATVHYPVYYCFARQVTPLKNRFGGGKGMMREVRILIDTWVARDCVESVLVKICFEVFGLNTEELKALKKK